MELLVLGLVSIVFSVSIVDIEVVPTETHT